MIQLVYGQHKLAFFVWVSKGKGRTWEDLEVRVHRVHDVNFPDYQYKYYAKRGVKDTPLGRQASPPMTNRVPIGCHLLKISINFQ